MIEIELPEEAVAPHASTTVVMALNPCKIVDFRCAPGLVIAALTVGGVAYDEGAIAARDFEGAALTNGPNPETRTVRATFRNDTEESLVTTSAIVIEPAKTRAQIIAAQVGQNPMMGTVVAERHPIKRAPQAPALAVLPGHILVPLKITHARQLLKLTHGRMELAACQHPLRKAIAAYEDAETYAHAY